jgi:hypothetical protein
LEHQPVKRVSNPRRVEVGVEYPFLLSAFDQIDDPLLWIVAAGFVLYFARSWIESLIGL